MSKHTTTLVPIDTWCYASPELKMKGIKCDIGLFAEALLYYDTVVIAPSTPDVFLEFIQYFQINNEMKLLYELFDEGILKIYDYAFISSAVSYNGEFSIWNIQDEKQSKSNTFEERYLYNKEIDSLFENKNRRKKFYDSIRGNYTEVKATEFENAIENARADYNNIPRHELIVQTFVNELYQIKKLGIPPEIKVEIDKFDNIKNTIKWNVNFSEISRISGTSLNFNLGTPLTALANSNKHIWSAAKLGCDLYMPSPMASIVMNKLSETSTKTVKPSSIINILENQIEFPDIRNLVNSKTISLKDIMEIRKKSKKFRVWIQSESERDRNVLIAYQNEFTLENDLTKFSKKTVNAFGIIGGGALGGIIGSMIAGPVGGAISGVAGSGIPYLMDLASKFDENWKPVVFGNWLARFVENKKI